MIVGLGACTVELLNESGTPSSCRLSVSNPLRAVTAKCGQSFKCTLLDVRLVSSGTFFELNDGKKPKVRGRRISKVE